MVLINVPPVHFYRPAVLIQITESTELLPGGHLMVLINVPFVLQRIATPKIREHNLGLESLKIRTLMNKGLFARR